MKTREEEREKVGNVSEINRGEKENHWGWGGRGNPARPKGTAGLQGGKTLVHIGDLVDSGRGLDNARDGRRRIEANESRESTSVWLETSERKSRRTNV